MDCKKTKGQEEYVIVCDGHLVCIKCRIGQGKTQCNLCGRNYTLEEKKVIQLIDNSFNN